MPGWVERDTAAPWGQGTRGVTVGHCWLQRGLGTSDGCERNGDKIEEGIGSRNWRWLVPGATVGPWGCGDRGQWG